VNHPEIIKLQKFLQLKFGNRAIDVRPRNKQNDSVEVYIGDEFLGLIFVDDEDGDLSPWPSSISTSKNRSKQAWRRGRALSTTLSSR
jgi:hypothetical protein